VRRSAITTSCARRVGLGLGHFLSKAFISSSQVPFSVTSSPFHHFSACDPGCGTVSPCLRRRTSTATREYVATYGLFLRCCCRERVPWTLGGAISSSETLDFVRFGGMGAATRRFICGVKTAGSSRWCIRGRSEF
jgi:hypothetical protein